VKPRPLSKPEQAEQMRHIQSSDWDEGVISEYMKLPTTQLCAYDLANGHTLILASHFPKHKNSQVATTLEALMEWLGVKRPFQIFLWLREDPRIIAANEWPSRRSVNGGWTIPGSSAICVYREEEWERVVLHEMIHALEWDWKMPTKPAACWGTERGSYMPALFEAWTELLAEWFWCAWFSVPWNKQQKWQTTQALQILARHDDKKDNYWRENTSVFAYYILKTVLSKHMPFLWLHQNGDTDSEREEFLCSIVQPGLAELEEMAESVTPESISLRMTSRQC
jgi:hypothetical protein